VPQKEVTPVIQTEHLSKTYRNGFEAVKDLSLYVNKSDIFGFLGRTARKDHNNTNAGWTA
jgi:ABC-type uncharacterized transport system ATPase subunit